MFDLKDKVTVLMYKAATTTGTLYFTWDCFGKSYYVQ